MTVLYSSTSIYGPVLGRGDLEAHILSTLSDWMITLVAEIERQKELPPRSTVVPPVPESIHADLDFTRFSSELFPEIVVVVQPTGAIERHEGGEYGQAYEVQIAAFVQVEGSQDETRTLADFYGNVLELLVQQGAWGRHADGTTFATRTRMVQAAGLVFPDPEVRDVLRTSVMFNTFIANIVSDLDGLRVPPADPYATPQPWPLADEVEVALIRGDPDTEGLVEADAVIVDGTVNPPVVRYERVEVDEP